jgi:hypothetical protein
MGIRPIHGGRGNRMSRPPTVLSRRAALATLAAAAYASATAGSMVEGMAVENELGPVFSPTGPDAELYGAAEGFPIADRSLPIQPGNPYQPKYRVGAFSHFDEIYPTRRIKRAATPWTFKRSQAEFRLSAGEGVAADRRGSRRDMAFGCGRARTGALRIQCGAARLRLGRLLAHDGACQDKQIIPAQWMIDATTVRASDAYLLPGKAMPTFGYGYLLWLLPGTRRQFALVGDLGQRICVDPDSKLVMVQTALETRAEVWRLWSAVVEQLGQR